MRSVARDGAVFVRPMGLEADPALNRYQYQRLASSPVASTCTECPYSGVAIAVPWRITCFIPSSDAISQSTWTDPLCQSCSLLASGMRRVHRTIPSWVGSPDATPAANGSAENWGEDWIADNRRSGYPLSL